MIPFPTLYFLQKLNLPLRRRIPDLNFLLGPSPRLHPLLPSFTFIHLSPLSPMFRQLHILRELERMILTPLKILLFQSFEFCFSHYVARGQGELTGPYFGDYDGLVLEGWEGDDLFGETKEDESGVFAVECLVIEAVDVHPVGGNEAAFFGEHG